MEGIVICEMNLIWPILITQKKKIKGKSLSESQIEKWQFNFSSQSGIIFAFSVSN